MGGKARAEGVEAGKGKETAADRSWPAPRRGVTVRGLSNL